MPTENQNVCAYFNRMIHDIGKMPQTNPSLVAGAINLVEEELQQYLAIEFINEDEFQRYTKDIEALRRFVANNTVMPRGRRHNRRRRLHAEAPKRYPEGVLASAI